MLAACDEHLSHHSSAFRKDKNLCIQSDMQTNRYPNSKVNETLKN